MSNADKCTATKFSERPAKLSDEQVAQICRLDLQQVPEVLIARGLKLNRRTVSRVLARMRAALSVSADLDAERGRALGVYRQVMREAWAAAADSKQRGRGSAPYLSVVLAAQGRIDRVLGLDVGVANDEIAVFKRTVVEVIRSEAPQVAGKLAQKFLKAADDA
jgi:hypothetical protein